MKWSIAGVWALAVGAAGWGATVTSLSGWIVLGCLALVPPIVMLRLWNDPPQSMSESIREARR